LILSKSCKPRISLVETGPLRGAIRIRYRMKIPVRRAEKPAHRRQKEETLRIWTLISLDYNSPYLRIATRINNTVQNHRLRVRFETGTNTRESYTWRLGFIAENSHKENSTNKMSPDYSQPLCRFVTVKDKERALTVFSKDTIAYQLCLDPKRTLVLTLLRSVGKLSAGEYGSKTNTTLSAQCQGEHFVEYALFPHVPCELNTFGHLNYQLEKFHVPMIAFQTKIDAAPIAPKTGVSLEPKELSILCFKEAEIGGLFIMRLVNPTPQTVQARCRFSFPIESAAIISYDELSAENPLPSRNGRVILSMKPKEIVTLKIKPSAS